MSDEQTSEQIAALLREREGYERYGNDQGVADVDAALRAIGAETPHERATKAVPRKRFLGRGKNSETP